MGARGAGSGCPGHARGPAAYSVVPRGRTVRIPPHVRSVLLGSCEWGRDAERGSSARRGSSCPGAPTSTLAGCRHGNGQLGPVSPGARGGGLRRAGGSTPRAGGTPSALSGQHGQLRPQDPEARLPVGTAVPGFPSAAAGLSLFLVTPPRLPFSPRCWQIVP